MITKSIFRARGSANASGALARLELAARQHKAGIARATANAAIFRSRLCAVALANQLLEKYSVRSTGLFFTSGLYIHPPVSAK